jgi:hypothetical protein
MIEKQRNYNETHPELEEGEMLLTNCVFETYALLKWTTKRWGAVAYTSRGVPLHKYRPVFVQRKEYEEGKNKNE